VGPKITLPSAIFSYALMNFLPRLTQNRRTIAVEECVYKPGSPGQVFKLDENSVIEYLEWLEIASQGTIRIQETAGLRQIYLTNAHDINWPAEALGMLEQYYERD
jgi:hypothetical protein